MTISTKPGNHLTMGLVEIALGSVLETARFGEAIGRSAVPGDIVYLDGELGAGKTTLTKAIASAIGIPSETVTSPTFSLLQEYRVGRLPLYHLDIYRLNKPGDLVNIGFDDYVAAGDGLIVIEWAVNAVDELPDDALQISLELVPNEIARRSARLLSGGKTSEALLGRILGLWQ